MGFTTDGDACSLKDMTVDQARDFYARLGLDFDTVRDCATSKVLGYMLLDLLTRVEQLEAWWDASHP